MKRQIKEKLIKDFIKENLKAPSYKEVNNLYNTFLLENPMAENVGLVASLTNTYPLAGSESSSSLYNSMYENIELDLEILLDRNKKYLLEVEEKFRIYTKKISNSLKLLKNFERRVNRDILLYLKQDIFSYGITESFEDYEKVDFNRSNISFYNGKATVSFKKVSSENFETESIKYTVNSRQGNILSQREVSSANNIKIEDGSHFKVIAISRLPNDQIDFTVDINFPESIGRNIETIKFVTSTPEINSKVSYRCLFSKDGSSFTGVFESDLRIKDGENFIEVNQDNVKKLRLIITKYSYDFIQNKEYNYVFSLDFLGHTRNTYKINEESILYLGPYEVLDEEEKPVNFSMAIIKGGTCSIVPDKTSIDMYLSKDDINWFKVDYNGNSKQVVQFEESLEEALSFELFSPVDLDSQSNYIAETIPDEINLNVGEKLLNFYVPADKIQNFVKGSLNIKRNLMIKDQEDLYEGSRGWYLDESNFYNTSFEISEPEGKYFSFGEAGCFLNSRQVFGKVFIPQGIHTLRTSKENWLDLKIKETEVKSVKQLKNIDKLYPYNHKYVIEGFNYSNIFKGKKTYKGASKVFAFNMIEVSNERFEISNGYEIYTFVETVNGLYIKIKNKIDSSESKLEDFNITYRRKSGSTVDNNKIYIKAILKTFDEKVTPKIEQIQVRVI